MADNPSLQPEPAPSSSHEGPNDQWPSDQWFTALDASVTSQSARWTCSITEPLIVAMHVRSRVQVGDEPDDMQWFLTVTKDALHVQRGIAADPTVTIFTDASVIEDLVDRRINAQQAVDANRLKVRGDLNRLAALGPSLTALTTMLVPQTGAGEPRTS